MGEKSTRAVEGLRRPGRQTVRPPGDLPVLPRRPPVFAGSWAGAPDRSRGWVRPRPLGPPQGPGAPWPGAMRLVHQRGELRERAAVARRAVLLRGAGARLRHAVPVAGGRRAALRHGPREGLPGAGDLAGGLSPPPAAPPRTRAPGGGRRAARAVLEAPPGPRGGLSGSPACLHACCALAGAQRRRPL